MSRTVRIPYMFIQITLLTLLPSFVLYVLSLFIFTTTTTTIIVDCVQLMERFLVCKVELDVSLSLSFHNSRCKIPNHLSESLRFVEQVPTSTQMLSPDKRRFLIKTGDEMCSPTLIDHNKTFVKHQLMNIDS